jgi:hypothetical protein
LANVALAGKILHRSGIVAAANFKFLARLLRGDILAARRLPHLEQVSLLVSVNDCRALCGRHHRRHIIQAASGPSLSAILDADELGNLLGYRLILDLHAGKRRRD